MKIIKMIPFYLFLAFNIFVALITIIDYPHNIMDNGLHWGSEAIGWEYTTKVHYTVFNLLVLLIFIAPSVYALLKRKTNLKRAYLVIIIPFLLIMTPVLYYYYFFNI